MIGKGPGESWDGVFRDVYSGSYGLREAISWFLSTKSVHLLCAVISEKMRMLSSSSSVSLVKFHKFFKIQRPELSELP